MAHTLVAVLPILAQSGQSYFHQSPNLVQFSRLCFFGSYSFHTRDFRHRSRVHTNRLSFSLPTERLSNGAVLVQMVALSSLLVSRPIRR
ncbi:hypothetical protein C8R45DRAFT_1047092 [Mycena sanguinolenta]|nr:hypothetical protein C8R45DRAFT_1047092 [Mycena sanguinolenta]